MSKQSALRLFIDTDILMDVALDRKGFSSHSGAILDGIQQGAHHGYMAWHSISNLNYLLRPKMGRGTTIQLIDDLTNFIEVAPTNNTLVKVAINLKMPDFEDALQTACAISCKADYLVTRNISHYKKSPIRVVSPKEFVGA